MKIVSLNIRHGGGKRTSQILDWLVRMDADVCILCEWRSNRSGLDIQLALQESGYQTAGYSRSASENGVLVATRSELICSRLTPAASTKGEIVRVTIASLSLLCGYFPQRHEKKPFFEVVTTELRQASRPTILIGDLNTGRNDIDLEEGASSFYCTDEFENLALVGGATDLWRLANGRSAREWSWRSSKNGFRIDHAFGNAIFTSAYPDCRCWYDHSTRLDRISDHSALLVELDAK